MNAVLTHWLLNGTEYPNEDAHLAAHVPPNVAPSPPNAIVGCNPPTDMEKAEIKKKPEVQKAGELWRMEQGNCGAAK